MININNNTSKTINSDPRNHQKRIRGWDVRNSDKTLAIRYQDDTLELININPDDTRTTTANTAGIQHDTIQQQATILRQTAEIAALKQQIQTQQTQIQQITGFKRKRDDQIQTDDNRDTRYREDEPEAKRQKTE